MGLFWETAEERLLKQIAISTSESVSLQRTTNYLLRRILMLSQPRGIVVTPLRERPKQGENEMDVIVASVSLSPLVGPHDVVERRVTVTVGADTVLDVVLGPSETEAGEFRGPEGSTGQVKLVDVDNAGQPSPEVVVDFTLADTFPPAAPGAPTIAFLREEITDDTPPGGGGGEV